MTPNTELSDERIFGLAKQHFGGSGHNLIWQDDPRYAAACDMTTDARWSVSAVRAEQTLAFARAILAASPAPLREAAKPVAWAVITPGGNVRLWSTDGEAVRKFAAEQGQPLTPLFAGIEADGDGALALHQRIMNLPCRVPFPHKGEYDEERAYKLGHRDARHAAAELALSPTSPPNGKTEGDGGWVGICTLEQNGEPRCGKQCGVCSDGVSEGRHQGVSANPPMPQSDRMDGQGEQRNG
jgi:hypothetical protein